MRRDTKKKIVRALDEKLAKTDARIKQYDERYAAAHRASVKMRARVEQLFESIGCWDAPESETLDKEEGCTDANIMRFLAIIEERVIAVVQSGRLASHDRTVHNQPAADLSASIFSQTATPLKINPPSTGDTFALSDDEGDEQTASRQDMKERSMRLGRKGPSSPGKKKPQGT